MDIPSNENEWLDIKDFSLITKDMADLMVRECEMGLKAKLESLQLITDRADKLMAIYLPICTALGIFALTNFSKLFREYVPTTAAICLIPALIGAFFCFRNIRHYEVGDLGERPDKILRSSYVDNKFNADFKFIIICIALCRNIQIRMDKNDFEILKRSRNNQFAIKAFFGIAISPLISFLIILLNTHQIWSFLH